MKRITVTGAGLSGTLLMINLFKQRSPEQVGITWIDRRDVFPMVQKRCDPYPSFYDELEGLSDILSVYKVVRKQLLQAKTQVQTPGR